MTVYYYAAMAEQLYTSYRRRDEFGTVWPVVTLPRWYVVGSRDSRRPYRDRMWSVAP